MWEMSGEYDYQFEAGSVTKRDEIIAALKYAYQDLMDKELALKPMDAKQADAAMITKPAVKERSKSMDPDKVSKAIESRRSIISSVTTQRAASKRNLGIMGGGGASSRDSMSFGIGGAGAAAAGAGDSASGESSASFGDSLDSASSSLPRGSLSALAAATASAGSGLGVSARLSAVPQSLSPSAQLDSSPANNNNSRRMTTLSPRLGAGGAGGGAGGAASANNTGTSMRSLFGGGGAAGLASGSAAQLAALEAASQPIISALSDAVAVLHDISSHSSSSADDNPALRTILNTWPDPEVLSKAYTLAEALYSANAGDAIFRGVKTDAGRAGKLLNAAGKGACFPLDAAVRGWCTRTLWKLLNLLRQASMLQEEVRTAGGFEGYIIRGFSVPPASAGSARDMLSLTPLVTKFEPEVYTAIMEILIDNVVKPSESLVPSKVETFGKLLVRPEQLKLLFRLLPCADWQLKHDVMKDLNVLLVQRPDNFPRILEQPEWMSWLAPLLANLPRKANDRDELMNEYLKYTINFFVMLLARAFSTNGATGDMDRCLGRFMAQMKMQCGWSDAVVSVIRNVVATLAQKVQTTADRWQRKYDRPEWENLFKLATVVEDFIFYRPVNTDGDGASDMSELLAEQAAGGVPMVLYMSSNLLHPASQMPIAPATVDPLDKSTPGLHLNMQTGEADDLKLAQRVVALFTAAGLTGDPATDPNVARATDKKAKDLLVHANSIMKIMKEIVAFLEDCNKSRLLAGGAEGKAKGEEAEKALLENLAKFLEKRQKQQKTGFLSRSATKKGIVQALQTNVMRQRAQQTVRAQVQATLMAKATLTTVTIEDDDEDEAPSGARTGTTAKRLQGTRAAVEQLTAQQQPGSGGASGTSGPSSTGAARPAVTSLRAAGLPSSDYSDARGTSDPSSSGADSSVVAAAAAEAIKASIANLDMEGQGEVDEAAAAAQAAAAAEAAGAGGLGAVGNAEGADGGAAGGAAGADAATEEDQRVADLICDRCSQPLLDDDGVMALGCKFHVNCFCCSECDVPFRDSPYYEKKGKAYCRNDYLKLFGKTVCAGCMEPLKRGQRALEAGSRVYHPEHFSCEGCGDVFAEDAQYYERDNAPYCSKCNLKLFGMCAGCNGQISGDRPAVSALNRNWHLSCIKCAACGGGFEDGVFFTSEDENGVMHAYCERDYLEIHAPRCRGCTDIIKDTGLHACGSSWHTQCFVCTVCRDPFPESNYFEVDGRPYCSNDYYNHFGTKCAGCGEFITDEVVNALGQQWHVGHFNCAKCSKSFGDFEYYEKDGKAYDEQCYCELFCPLCPVCGCYVVEEASVALGIAYHPWCLRCSHCGEQLTSTVHQASDGRLYCDQDFMALVAYTCKKCGALIQAESVQALDAHWHPECFTCSWEGEGGEQCDANLANDESGGFHEIEGKPYCAQHHADLKCEKCAGCGRGIIVGTGLSALKQNWHPECLVCANCASPMTDKIYSREGRPTCEDCFLATAEKCAGCGKGIIGKFLSVLGRKYHPEPGCLSCTACGVALSGGNLYPRKQWPVCKDHARGELTAEEEARFASVENRFAEAAAATAAAQAALAANFAGSGSS